MSFTGHVRMYYVAINYSTTIHCTMSPPGDISIAYRFSCDELGLRLLHTTIPFGLLRLAKQLVPCSAPANALARLRDSSPIQSLLHPSRPPGYWYVDRPLPGGSAKIDRPQSISAVGGRLREKKGRRRRGKKERRRRGEEEEEKKREVPPCPRRRYPWVPCTSSLLAGRPFTIAALAHGQYFSPRGEKDQGD
ncbi:hypothetical protein B296_00026405, partial [Ensete ventricosum]